ncbi:amidohydrolase [Endozoicomonas elysicola]|uniref:Metal-dependent hydrolase n=1 Tax=Endozoicomonas elysicola TaxID=305900 RepID=A0A081KEM6_9GAMM|nr:amidohydrolase [Endozoicomonas elysicola]KEI72602.1 metal-dependent hydrolase [Endozoicomonas elysicola]
MKNTFKLTVIAAIVALTAGCVQQADNENTASAISEEITSNPVTLYIADDIITMSESAAENITAIAVQNGKILDLGESAELLERYAEHPNLLVDKQFEHNVITPGFVEPHIHLWLSGILMSTDFITPGDWKLPWGDVAGVQTEETFIRRLREIEATKPEGEPLIVWGYHNYFHGNRMGRELINQVSDTRPIIVWHRSFHELFYNDAALNMLGWEESDWKGEGAAYEQLDWERGHAFENGAKVVLNDTLKFLVESGRFAMGMERTRDYVQSAGITTAVDPGVIATPEMYQQMVSILLDDDFPMDYWLMPAGNFTYSAGGYDALKGKAIAESQTQSYKGQDQIQWLPKFVKLFSDGAMYSQLMQLKDGYTDGHHGEWLQTPEELEDSMRPYWEDDYTVVIHANGDLGFEAAIEVLETLNKETPRDDHRTSFHHLGITDKNDIPRAVKSGANFSVNPYYTHVLAELYSEKGVGKERAEVMARGRSFIDAGGILSLHSDAPMAPAQPITLMWAAVNRIGLSGETVMGSSERITVHEAMKAITIDAAYTARLENEIGSIDVGKYANFAVLDQNPYKVDKQDLNDINVMATVYRGESSLINVSNAGMKVTANSLSVLELENHYGHNHEGKAHGDFCETALYMQQAMGKVVN